MSDDLKARLRTRAATHRWSIDCYDEKDDLSAAASRIAELEQQLYEARNSAYRNTRRSYENEARAQAAEAKCERLRSALREAQDAFQDSRIGTTGMDTPEFYQMLWRTSDRVALVLADTPDCTALNADQQDTRKPGPP